MKRPKRPGAPVDMTRMRGWLADFGNFRHSVTERRIELWLDQFDLPHIDLAARVLDCVDFIATEKIGASFRSALAGLPGWHVSEQKRVGKWRFAAFSSSAGESGDAMLHKFRHANNLAGRKHHELFVHRSELLSAGLERGDSVVFVDDFAGTGTQITNAWPLFSELLPDGVNVYLILVAASKKALDKVEAETGLDVRAEIVLGESDEVFNDKCTVFDSEEKAILKKYCAKAGSQSAEQFSSDGFVIVFAHTCPNNALPILHANRRQWEGLFRRYD